MTPPRLQGLAFLELGERLRQRGQYEAAATVAIAGLAHYPALADAHDLLGRIRADQGQDAAAIASWHAALECDPGHVGALKGLAFVAFRGRDFATAERHLEQAAREAPHDATLLAALDKVRAARPASAPEAAPQLADLASGLLLFDGQGMRLTGGVGPETTADDADATAAEGAGLAREAVRAARLLQLGQWQHLLVEGAEFRLAALPVSADATLLVCRPATTPAGRLLATATRAGLAARDWLERMT
jgi:tetratricopeptide (TPR) repeat protein